MQELWVVQLFPCHGMETRKKCGVWVSTEWWGTQRDNAYKGKREDMREFGSITEAREHYASRWSEHAKPEDFVVTTSHTICKTCRAERRRLYDY